MPFFRCSKILGGRQARHLTTNVPKILDLKSSSEQIFSKHCRWVPLTASVRSLFHQASETIYLPPERIIWCYSQWQPAYTKMLVAMRHIEFVKRIPTALEQDSYFDVNRRNLIVFDDQMIDAGKDKRIVNLFTRGSHHRNLGVIYIVQNLFRQGKGSRSISLNSVKQSEIWVRDYSGSTGLI